MKKRTRLEAFDVPKPCAVAWESMRGTAAVRECARCERQIHDLSALTRAEAEQLLSGGERICVRLVRTANGRIVTADAPLLPAPYRRPWTGVSVAALAAVLGLSEARGSAARSVTPPSVANVQAAPAIPARNAPRNRSVHGTVLDATGAPFPDATVTASDLTTREEFSVQTGADGRYRLPVPEGTYQVRITSQPFESYVVSRVKMGRHTRIDATLHMPTLGEVVTVHENHPEPGILKQIVTAPVRALKALFTR
jgi:hypothetical protein